MVLLVKIGDLFSFEADYPEGERVCSQNLSVIANLIHALGASAARDLIVREAEAAVQRGEFTRTEEK